MLTEVDARSIERVSQAEVFRAHLLAVLIPMVAERIDKDVSS